MTSRRRTLLLGGCTLGSALAGCLDTVPFSDDSKNEDKEEDDEEEPSQTRAPLHEVRVRLENGYEEAHTFHVALETETGVFDWKSQKVPPQTMRVIVFDPPEDASVESIHGVVDDIIVGGGHAASKPHGDSPFCHDYIIRHANTSRGGTGVWETFGNDCSSDLLPQEANSLMG